MQMFPKSSQLVWPIAILVVGLWEIGGAAVTAQAEIVKLTTGGEIYGDVINQDESPRIRYVIRLYAGGEITLPASQVVSIVSQRPVEEEYHRQLVEHGDSVQDHWEMAEWCRAKKLTAQRQFHLERILQLDSDHADARRALGYGRVDGKWMTRDEQMKARGYVKYNGRWMLPQRVHLEEKKEKEKKIEKEWHKKIKRYHSWLIGNQGDIAKKFLLAITDPHATKALVHYCGKSKSRQHQEIYASALANVGTEQAWNVLTEATLDSSDEDFREHCFELLEEHKPKSAVAFYVKALKDKDNQRVNRAARGLQYTGDASVISPLIDALITEHRTKEGGTSPGAVSTSFGGVVGGPQSSSFSSGGAAKIVIRRYQNKQVNQALFDLTGKDFHFNQGAWRGWYATQKPAAPKINSRRDD